MTGKELREPRPDWSSATWEGATREQMRRWAELPLERIIAAQEEMAELAQALGHRSLQRKGGETQ